MNILIDNHDLGFLTAQPITVQCFDGDELIYCNHAGAVEEVQHNQINLVDQPDILWYSRVLLCDKANCGAYKREGDDCWEYA